MRVVGIMSGTSVDGIDVVIAEIDGNPALATLAIQQLAFMTVPWNPAIQRHIFALFEGTGSALKICRLNFVLAEAFARAVQQVLQAAHIPLPTIDLIGSHGQTIWHDVENGQVSSTLQLGDPLMIAIRTGITTVGNFRVADVAAGGQGAPLVSIFDWYLDNPPKTTGRELFSRSLAEQWWSDAIAAGLSKVDFVATVTEVTAISIANAYARFAPGPVTQVVVGGAHNSHLLRRLAFHLQQQLGGPVELCTHTTLGIDDKAKEALAFALLAYLIIQGWPGNVPACTGVHSQQILGQIAPGSNYATLFRQ